MEEKKSTYDNRTLALWLIKLTLLFNVFAFSDYNAYLPTLQESTTTELEISKKPSSVKHIASLNQSLTTTALAQDFASAQKTQEFALTNYNLKVKTQFKALAKTFLAHQSPVLIFKKSTPFPYSNSNDDLPNLVQA